MSPASLLSWAAGESPHHFRQGQPDRADDQRQSAQPTHGFRRRRIAARQPVGIPPPIQYCRQRVWSRGPRVWNDRAGEVGRTLNVKDFDLDRIFGKEGVQFVHLSGLIGALSPETGQFCLELARAAKKHGTRIGFDLNYRASFWKGREKELSAIFARNRQCCRRARGQRRGLPALPRRKRTGSGRQRYQSRRSKALRK